MYKLLTLLFVLTCCKTVCSQNIQLYCGDSAVRCEHGGKKHFYNIMYCPYTEYSDTNIIPSSVRQRNHAYLTSRLGQTFFQSKVKLRGIVVVDAAKSEEIHKTKGWTNNSMCDKNVRYAFEYYFSVQDSLNFYFTTIYDNNGNLLFDHQVPDVNLNPTFAAYIDACQVCNIARSDTKLAGDIQSLKLDFDATKNTFIWVVEKPGFRSGKDNKTIHSRYLLIHAQTGKIIDYKTTKSKIVCALPPF